MSDRAEPRRASDGEGSFRGSCCGKIERPSRRERESCSWDGVHRGVEGDWGPAAGNRAAGSYEATLTPDPASARMVADGNERMVVAIQGVRSGHGVQQSGGGARDTKSTRQTQKRRVTAAPTKVRSPPDSAEESHSSRVGRRMPSRGGERAASWPIAGE